MTVCWYCLDRIEDGPCEACDERAVLLDEIQRLRFQDVHHYLHGVDDGQFVPCGLDLTAIAHRDPERATCTECRHYAFSNGLLAMKDRDADWMVATCRSCGGRVVRDKHRGPWRHQWPNTLTLGHVARP